MAHRSACRAALDSPRLRRGLAGLVALVLLALPAGAAAQVQTINVQATVETAPVPHASDAADDPAVWIHPTDPSLSTIIGTDKEIGGGLGVYDLSGRELFYYADGRLNNVDVKYNFPLGGSKVSLVAATNRLAKRIDFYRVDPATRGLVKAGSVPTPNVVTPRGIALYVSPVSGKYYAFVTDSGRTEQWELSGATGSVTGTSVRTFNMPVPHTEGLVADDELGRIYIAEEDIGGVFRLGAEPGDSNVPVLVDATTENGGTIPQDIKGITIYFGANGTGYLIATSQGDNSFHVYRRGDNVKVGVFKIVDGAIDGVTGIDGIDVTNFNLGPAFPSGLFVTQDTANPGFNQNFKAVPWQSIANGFGTPLLIDSTWDPRKIGASGGGGAADVTPPTITSTTPAAGASGAPVATTVRAVFSELMSSASLTATTFRLVRQGQTASVAAAVTYDQATRTATLDPTADLAPSATYTATVTTGVRDVAGNAMAAARTWTFTTAAAGVTPPAPPPPPPPPPPAPTDPAPSAQTAPPALSVTAPAALTTPASASTAPAAVDTKAPAATLTGAAQRLGTKVALGISCIDEACRATTAATVSIPKAGNARAKTYTLRARTTAVARGAKATVRLNLSSSARAAIRRALRSGARIVVSLRVSVADDVGNSRTLTKRIRLRL